MVILAFIIMENLSSRQNMRLIKNVGGSLSTKMGKRYRVDLTGLAKSAESHPFQIPSNRWSTVMIESCMSRSKTMVHILSARKMESALKAVLT